MFSSYTAGVSSARVLPGMLLEAEQVVMYDPNSGHLCVLSKDSLRDRLQRSELSNYRPKVGWASSGYRALSYP